MSCVSLKNWPSFHRAHLTGPSSIHLTELEDTVCTLLKDFIRELHKQDQVIECYIAGGWVRDKLLGLESNDIDIALSSMMGFPFALRWAEYLKGRGIEITRVTKVESRAEQSKHLETAKLGLLGIELDLVNLRSEEYAESSRIPTSVKFGTPLEDTLRRDITINALFYNVQTNSVEDHTGKGLDDLRRGVIRTPLPPRQTFLDDPLRVIRCIRFASRFGYGLVPELADAAKDREIQTAFETKITRERIGDEVDKMMKGPDPLCAAQLIDSLSLHRSIFAPPSSVSIPVPDSVQHYTALAAVAILHQFLSSAASSSNHALTSLFEEMLPSLRQALLHLSLSDPSMKRRLFMAAILTPFRRQTYVEKKRTKSLVEACLREGLKLGLQHHYLDGIPALFAASDLLCQPRLEKFETPSPRVALGLLLRDKAVHNPHTGSHWTSSLLFSLVQELVSLWDSEKDSLNTGAAKDIIGLYATFVRRVEELDLADSLEKPPLLNGHEVSSLFGSKPGPWTGRVLNQVIEWQLAHPEGTKDECSGWLADEFKAGRIEVKPGAATERADTRQHKKVRLSKDV